MVLWSMATTVTYDAPNATMNSTPNTRPGASPRPSTDAAVNAKPPARSRLGSTRSSSEPITNAIATAPTPNEPSSRPYASEPTWSTSTDSTGMSWTTGAARSAKAACVPMATLSPGSFRRYRMLSAKPAKRPGRSSWIDSGAVSADVITSSAIKTSTKLRALMRKQMPAPTYAINRPASIGPAARATLNCVEFSVIAFWRKPRGTSSGTIDCQAGTFNAMTTPAASDRPNSAQ